MGPRAGRAPRPPAAPGAAPGAAPRRASAAARPARARAALAAALAALAALASQTAPGGGPRLAAAFLGAPLGGPGRARGLAGAAGRRARGGQEQGRPSRPPPARPPPGRTAAPPPARPPPRAPARAPAPLAGQGRAPQGAWVADIFELPRGLLEGRRMWSCPYGEKDVWAKGCLTFTACKVGSAVLVQDFREGRQQEDIAPPPECIELREADLQPDEYLRLCKQMLKYAVKLATPPPKRERHSVGHVEIVKKYTFRALYSSAAPFVGITFEDAVMPGDDLTLEALGLRTIDQAQELVGSKVLPVLEQKRGNEAWKIVSVKSLTDDFREEMLQKLAGRTDMLKKWHAAPKGIPLLELEPQEDYNLPWRERIKKRPRKGKLYAFLPQDVQPRVSPHANGRMRAAFGPTAMPPFPITKLRKTPQQRRNVIDNVVKDACKLLGWPSLPRATSGGHLASVQLPLPPLVVGKSGLRTTFRDFYKKLEQHGMYHVKASGAAPSPLSVLYLTPGATSKPADTTMKKIYHLGGETFKRLQSWGVELRQGCEGAISRSSMAGFHMAEKQGPDAAALVFGCERGLDDRDWEAVKQEMLQSSGDGQPHMAVQGMDLAGAHWQRSERFAVMNCAMGLAGKLGHAPFGVECGAWARDSRGREVMAVGIDVSRVKGLNVATSLRVSAHPDREPHVMSRIEASEQPTGGENTEHALRAFLPREVVDGKVVVIHRDGKFWPDELEFLKQYQQRLSTGTAFVCVQVVKDGKSNPRIYGQGGESAEEGTAIVVESGYGKKRAFLVTSNVRKGMVARPIEVSYWDTFGDVDPHMKERGWFESVWDLVFLYHGSIFSHTRLPATLHAADRLAGMFTTGGLDVAQGRNFGEQQFWL